MALIFSPILPFYAGDTWSGKTTQTTLLKMDVDIDYTLDDVENNIGTVKSVSRIKGSNANTANALTNQPTGNLEGKGKSSYKINMQTGMLIEEESRMSVEGKIQVNGIEMPVSIEIKKKISGRKLR